jgi:hypothetical protein
MVVWTRAPTPVHPDSGELTPVSRAMIAEFVKKYFADKFVGRGTYPVLWFRNWGSLRSVPSIDHIHVLIRDADQRLVTEWVDAPGLYGV